MIDKKIFFSIKKYNNEKIRGMSITVMNTKSNTNEKSTGEIG